MIMEAYSDSLYLKVHSLVVKLFEGTLAHEELRELESLILEDETARQAYLDYMHESAGLRWLCVEEFPDVVQLADRPREQVRPSKTWRQIAGAVLGGVLACGLLAFAAHWLYSGKDQLADSKPRLA